MERKNVKNKRNQRKVLADNEIQLSRLCSFPVVSFKFNLRTLLIDPFEINEGIILSSTFKIDDSCYHIYGKKLRITFVNDQNDIILDKCKILGLLPIPFNEWSNLHVRCNKITHKLYYKNGDNKFTHDSPDQFGPTSDRLQIRVFADENTFDGGKCYKTKRKRTRQKRKTL